jgi:hypothetical protein
LGLGPGCVLERPAAGGIDLDGGGADLRVAGQGDRDGLLDGQTFSLGRMGGNEETGRQDGESQ